MFEDITFHTIIGNYASADFSKQERYRNFLAENEILENENLEYQIDGSIRYLLSKQLPVDRKEELSYIQSFSYMKSGPNYYTKRNGFDSFLLLFTYEGLGVLDYEGKQYRICARDGFFIDCQKPHRYHTEGACWTHGDLHIRGGNTAYLHREFFARSSPVFHPIHPNNFQTALENVLQAHQMIDPARDFKVSALLNHLLLIVHEGLSKSTQETIPENILTVQQYMEQHFAQELSIEELSGIAHLSKYHLIRQFRRYFGFTPHEYIINLRLSQAENMLLMTNLPAYKIGFLAGFPSEANFIAHFKRVYGTTPGKARG